MTVSDTDRRIRSLRPPKLEVDPLTAHGSLLEPERRPDGRTERALTVFLAGAECPFTCSFCDLWRFTTDGPTQRGALTTQLDRVLDRLDKPFPDRLKLYNASNFFDQRAVPSEDLPGIAALATSFAAVTVESHASTIGPRTAAFSEMIEGRLEVAVGLETIHPVAMTQLNKRLDLARFDWAAAYLCDNDIDLRVFVLLGAPYVPAEESIDWTRRTVDHAVRSGASIVSIIPVRGGNGEMERLQHSGHFSPPSLSQLEQSLDECLTLTNAVITADLWDADRLPSCAHCRSARIERLKRINLSGRAEQSVLCSVCIEA